MPLVISSSSKCSTEAVVRVDGDGGGHQWYQLYWCAPSFTPQANAGANRLRGNDVTLSILSRAKAAVFAALVWRPRDLETACLPFKAGAGAQVGASDFVFMQRMGIPAA